MWCAKQFKSKFVNYDLSSSRAALDLPGPGVVEFHYYEVGHGKNGSDRVGAVGKAAYLRGTATKDWDQTPTTIEEVASLIQRNLPGEGKADFLDVLVVPPLERPPADERRQIPLAGIQKLDSLRRLEDGRLLGSRVSCLECIANQVIGGFMSHTCAPRSCAPSVLPWSPSSPLRRRWSLVERRRVRGRCSGGCRRRSLVRMELQMRRRRRGRKMTRVRRIVMMKTPSLQAVLCGAGQLLVVLFDVTYFTMQSHFSSTCHSRTRSWYAGQVLGLLGLPEQVVRDLGKNPSGSVIVKRFGFDDLKVIRPDRLDSLGENRVDRARAAVSPEIGAGYDIALAVINGDM